MKKQLRYYAFISYNHKDSTWAKWLQDELSHYILPEKVSETNGVPLREFKPVFRYEDDMCAGDLDSQVTDALRNSDYLLVVCSPNAVKSEYVDKEIQEFIKLGDEAGKNNRYNIIPFIVDGVPHNKERECFPQSLLDLKREGYELIGGDRVADGLNRCFVKILAGTLRKYKVGMSQLWDKYEQEKIEQERKEREEKNKLLAMQSRFLAEKAISLVNKGDSYTARILSLHALPQKINDPDRPYQPEAEAALRLAMVNESAIFNHLNLITSVKLSYDDRFIISSSLDGTLKLWDCFTGRMLYVISFGKMELCFDVALNSTSELIAVATKDIATNENLIRVVRVKDQKLISTLKGHTADIKTLKFSPDNANIISVSVDKTIRIWNVEDEIETNSYNFNISSVCHSELSPDTNYIALTEDDDILQLFEVRNPKKDPIILHHNSIISKIIFAPNSKFVATLTRDNTIKIWNLSGFCLKTLFNNNISINSISFSGNGKILAALTSSGYFLIWDLDSFNRKKRVYIQSKQIKPNIFELNTTGDIVVSICQNNSISFNRLDNSGCAIYRNISNATFSPDGTRIIATSYGRNIKIIDSRTTQLIRCKYMHILEKEGAIGYLCPLGDKIIYEDPYFPSRVYVVSTENYKQNEIFPKSVSCRWFYDKKGEKMAFVSSKHKFNICDLTTGTISPIDFIDHKNDINNLTFSDDGKYVLTSSSNDTIKVWIIETGEIIFNKKIKGNETLFCNQNKWIASVLSCDQTNSIIINIWEVETGEIIKTIKHNYDVRFVQYVYIHDNGLYLFVVTVDNEVFVFDLLKGSLTSIFKSHHEDITSIAFSPDGKNAITASRDDSVRVWCVESGLEVCQPMFGHNKAGFLKLSVSSDGSRIAAIDDTDNLYIWKFPSLQQLIDEAREQFKDRELTIEERRKYYLE